MDQVFGTTEVALKFGHSPEWVRLQVRLGRLPCMQTPSGRRVYRAEDVERFAAEREQQRQKKAKSK